MFSKLAAIATAAILFATPQAQALDTSVYFAPFAVERLANGEVEAILQGDAADTEEMMFYATGFAGALAFLWKDNLPEHYDILAMIKVANLLEAKTLDTATVNKIFAVSAGDAETFAAQYDFSSATAQSMLATLQSLIEN